MKKKENNQMGLQNSSGGVVIKSLKIFILFFGLILGSVLTYAIYQYERNIIDFGIVTTASITSKKLIKGSRGRPYCEVQYKFYVENVRYTSKKAKSAYKPCLEIPNSIYIRYFYKNPNHNELIEYKVRWKYVAIATILLFLYAVLKSFKGCSTHLRL